MSELILMILMLNVFTSLVVFLGIMEINNNNFIEWVKHAFEVRNLFGKLQICLLITWMMPAIIICTVVYPIAWLLGSIVAGIIFGCMKLAELGKK